ncbi:MAG: hypothetical protein JNK82_09870 [Myxococcaceae bacterium]|nr:hypothetical protein [Myxococcaceae bacterium]
MKRDVALALAVMAAGFGLVLVACGAENAEAPRRAPLEGPVCRGFDQLAPNFTTIINQNSTYNLACVVRTKLLQEVNGEAPPLNDVLRAVFGLIDGFASQPAERNAPPKQPNRPQELCAPDESEALWPPVAQANQLCEIRRLLYVLVHQGKGIDVIDLVDPQLSGALNYILGRGKDKTKHFEIAGVVSRACSQNGQCQLSNGLDLLVALSAYLESTEGKKTLDDVRVLLNSPTIQGFLDSSAPNALSEDGAVAIARILGPAIQNASPSDLQNLIEQPPLNQFKTELQPLIDDLKFILGRPELMNPLKRSLVCLTYSDPNYDLVRMLHRLGLRDQLPEFGIRRLAKLLDDLQVIDQRGALIHLLGTLSAAIVADEQAIDSAAKVCQTLFSTTGTAGQSNAERALPVVADLLAAGVGNEVMCALDTLVWGCSGTTQPACAPSMKPVPPPMTGEMMACECKVFCGAQKPCGDECIAATATCSAKPGTACP